MILDIQNLRKDYGDFQLECSMQIPEGVVTGLIGANGAGKSTLFKSLLGLISTDGGRIEIFGKDIAEITVEDKEKIGAVLAQGGFSSYLTIEKMIPVLKSMYHRFDGEAFLSQCARFKLPVKKKLREMSTGMRAKVNILTAMSYEAKLLILDEPTAGLDVLARNELIDMMRGYMESGNRSILISSHISSDLEGLCDDVYLIHQGKIVLHEDTDTLLDTFGILKLTQEQYEQIKPEKLLYVQKERYGYHCLTKDRQFCQDNYPEIVVEKGSIDEILLIVEKGEKV